MIDLIFFGYNGDAQEKATLDFWCDAASGYPDMATILNFWFLADNLRKTSQIDLIFLG
jgi:hypothetical protein